MSRESVFCSFSVVRLFCFFFPTLSCPLRYSSLETPRVTLKLVVFFLRGVRETVLSIFYSILSLLLLSMDDLAANWNNLSLSDKEQKGFIMRTDHQTGEYMLAAFFLTPRFLLMDAVARTFKQLWRSTNGFKLKRLGEHKVLFVFDNLPDIDRIIQNQPWSFDKHLVVIQRYDSDTPARNLILTKPLSGCRFMTFPLDT